MGLWGAFKSCASKVSRAISSGVSSVCNKAKEAAKKVVTKVQEVSKKVKSKVTNVWNKFTGKDKYEEAKKLLEEITSRFNLNKEKFEQESNRIFYQIEKNISKVNECKQQILNELLPEMVDLLSKMKDVEIPKEFYTEEFIKQNLNMDSVRTKADLFMIDFDKHKVKISFQAIFTLGFYTRKKAKETLLAVKEEEMKINEQIAKMEAELLKLQGINKAIENAVNYFDNLVVIYQRLLGRVDHSINSLYVKSMTFTHKLVSKNLSIRMLNVIAQKDIQSLITASKILKKMGETKFSNMEKETVSKFEYDAKISKSEMEDILIAA